MLERPSRQQRRGLRRRPAFARVLLAAIALVLAFLLGIAFARTLDERPSNGGTETSVRTLTPLPQQGSVRTVTLTVTQP
jgi:hypothetical protein